MFQCCRKIIPFAILGVKFDTRRSGLNAPGIGLVRLTLQNGTGKFQNEGGTLSHGKMAQGRNGHLPSREDRRFSTLTGQRTDGLVICVYGPLAVSPSAFFPTRETQGRNSHCRVRWALRNKTFTDASIRRPSTGFAIHQPASHTRHSRFEHEAF